MLRGSSLGAGGLVFSSVQNRKLGRGREEGFETVIRSSASPGVHYIVRSSLRGRADTSTRTAGKPLLGVLPPNISEQMQLQGTQLPIGGRRHFTRCFDTTATGLLGGMVGGWYQFSKLGKTAEITFSAVVRPLSSVANEETQTTEAYCCEKPLDGGKRCVHGRRRRKKFAF